MECMGWNAYDYDFKDNWEIQICKQERKHTLLDNFLIQIVQLMPSGRYKNGNTDK